MVYSAHGHPLICLAWREFHPLTGRLHEGPAMRELRWSRRKKRQRGEAPVVTIFHRRYRCIPSYIADVREGCLTAPAARYRGARISARFFINGEHSFLLVGGSILSRRTTTERDGGKGVMVLGTASLARCHQAPNCVRKIPPEARLPLNSIDDPALRLMPDCCNGYMLPKTG